MPAVLFLIELWKKLRTLFYYSLQTKVVWSIIQRYIKKYLFRHHFRIEEEEAANCLMPPTVLAFLLIVCYPYTSIGVLYRYLSYALIIYRYLSYALIDNPALDN